MTERPRGLSVRLKLTLTYAAFVVIVGVAVFALGFLTLRFIPDGNLFVQAGGWAPRRVDLQSAYVKYAWWALLGLAAVGLVGGWIVAGWMLRPLVRITDAARLARDGSLSHRIALPGRGDELTDLADTFNAMLERMTRTIESERRFAANASHELRTPHAVIRTLLEVARADPEGRDVEVLLERLAETNERAIRLTEALLRLSRVTHGAALEHEAVDLAELVIASADDQRAAANGTDIRIAADEAVAAGDPALLAQLVDNLVRNAVVHNLPERGSVDIRVTVSAREVVLTVANTGAILDDAVVQTLVEPFVRAEQRTRRGGEGLGLAIVAAIVRAHDGRIVLRARPDGGLLVEVALPAA